MKPPACFNFTNKCDITTIFKVVSTEMFNTTSYRSHRQLGCFLVRLNQNQGFGFHSCWKICGKIWSFKRHIFHINALEFGERVVVLLLLPTSCFCSGTFFIPFILCFLTKVNWLLPRGKAFFQHKCKIKTFVWLKILQDPES